MFYIYILFSNTAQKYYVGYTSDPKTRLFQHNNSPFNTYTSKFRPWTMVGLFECGTDKRQAIAIERFIKKQKSTRLLRELIDGNMPTNGVLSDLVRVPPVRD